MQIEELEYNHLKIILQQLKKSSKNPRIPSQSLEVKAGKSRKEKKLMASLLRKKLWHQAR